MNRRPHYFVVIGDLVRSKKLADERSDAQDRLLEMVAELNAQSDGSQRVDFVVSGGDEVEGMFQKPVELRRALWIMSGVFPDGIRIGIGYGPLATKLSDNVLENDGPAFHSAREAIELIPRRSRTAGSEKIKFLGMSPRHDVILDGLVAVLWHGYRGLKVRQREVVGYLRDGLEQKAIAGLLGISPQQVSGAARAAGADALIRAEAALDLYLGEAVGA